ncbi:hypothetical protein KCP73_11760 [Salmonella enterica subsp. enterica]|nr:hypothetical protein KCP73_11760 [Salmonella enterica subsp. enterica]
MGKRPVVCCNFSSLLQVRVRPFLLTWRLAKSPINWTFLRLAQFYFSCGTVWFGRCCGYYSYDSAVVALAAGSGDWLAGDGAPIKSTPILSKTA